MTSPICLKELDSIKCAFVPFFLNYLREQTSSLVQASHMETVASLTPSKTPIKTKSRSELKSVTNSRRVRLFAQNSAERENSCNLNISVDETIVSTLRLLFILFTLYFILGCHSILINALMQSWLQPRTPNT